MGLTAVLLCAGYATRMGALTADFPKALLPVDDRPILDDLVDQLEATGRIERFVVVTNHRDHAHFVAWREARMRADRGKGDRVGGASRGGSERASITLIDDGTTTNAGRLGAIGDLDLALRTEGLTGPLLVAAGDNFFRIDWRAYLDALDRSATSMVLLDRERDPSRLRRSGVAEVDANGRLVRLHEKPEQPPSEDCCPPLYWLDAAALAEIPRCLAADPTADAPGHLIAWVALRHPVRTHRLRGARLDVGDPESYRQASRWLREHPRVPLGTD
jgi:glucose-1-phosphate thymidylyltransferase